MSAKPQGTVRLIRRNSEDQVKNWQDPRYQQLKGDCVTDHKEKSRAQHDWQFARLAPRFFAIAGLIAMTKIKASAPLSIKNPKIPLNWRFWDWRQRKVAGRPAAKTRMLSNAVAKPKREGRRSICLGVTRFFVDNRRAIDSSICSGSDRARRSDRHELC
jgi:hypothetical protein